MLIRNEKIKLKGNPLNINFNLESTDDFHGYEQEINTLLKNTGDSLINSETDGEVRRFNSIGTPQYNIYFYGRNPISPYDYGYACDFARAEITGVASTNPNLSNSFFMFDFYDTFDVNTQKKIFRMYLTDLITEDGIPSYTIDVVNQISKWNVPMWYINTHQGEVITGYVRILFYNATNSSVVPFYNKQIETYTTTEKMFFKTILDIDNRTWQADAINNAYQLINTSYTNNLNKTVQGLLNKKQNYGKAVGTFNPATREYFI